MENDKLNESNGFCFFQDANKRHAPITFQLDANNATKRMKIVDIVDSPTIPHPQQPAQQHPPAPNEHFSLAQMRRQLNDLQRRQTTMQERMNNMQRNVNKVLADSVELRELLHVYQDDLTGLRREIRFFEIN